MLGANYPGTDWYKRAYELMQDNREKLGQVQVDAEAPAPMPAPAQPQATPTS